MNDLHTHTPTHSRSLKQLLADWATAVQHTNHPQPPAYHGPDATISHLTENTQEVTPGAGFVARVRVGSDGHPYIGQALARGASLILAQRPAADLGLAIPDGVAYLEVADTAEAAAWLAAAWESFPGRQLVMIGVTGTDGKTTTSSILHSILQAAGLRVGLLSTLKAVVGEKEEPLAPHVTTPEAPVVQRYLRRMVDAGLTHCILESTSHGLAQHRVTAVDFDIAVITNITHEHLDYHGSYEGYFAAKSRLFTSLLLDDWAIETHNPAKQQVVKTAVLNLDDSSFARLQAIPVPHQVSYGLSSHAEVTARHIRYDPDKTWFDVQFSSPLGRGVQPTEQPFTVSCVTHLLGEFNLYNILAATAVARVLQIAPEAIQAGLAAVKGVSGRMERIHGGQPCLVIVDFAHTPNSLERSIAAARQMVAERNGRVLTVFGSAGKRDVEKRRMMAEISAQRADVTILTAEDPRTESLDDILEMMAFGCRSKGGIEGRTFWRVPDRGTAVYFALTLARSQDVVLICGKGHEQTMCFGVTEYPWDDRKAALAAIKAFLAKEPMPDLGLPTGKRLAIGD
ncbi:MAG: UDP-N-acetylmuramoyl-L-alanyl-D-glutamate--2,6-diaminopimelate ligase [Chloroflexi bacterium]|nr:UDP-N-acetylmuramoyl-L-alanyl-D-glutamate--2,6-diaminopimelate ligase [Chloroflexota bacterium]MBK6712069.1 UDP-N-acetylmuramoyl-L-alanyl-D-glutamate--2,6-diaminopimelate ligase [Chloroflexota bacterium]